MIKEFIRFGAVGLIALCVHLLIVIFLVATCKMLPLIANILGFLLAFQVSYWGHCKWTFRAHSLSHKQTMSQLFIVSFSSFVLNEILYAALLSLTRLPYDIALLIVLAFVSGLTFILSKFWVFRTKTKE